MSKGKSATSNDSHQGLCEELGESAVGSGKEYPGGSTGPVSHRVCLQQGRAAPDKDENGFAVVGPIHNPRRAQEGLQDFHQAGGQLVHLIKEEKGSATGSEVPLDPALELLLCG